MSKKKVDSFVKIQIKAGEATAAPPIGTALGPKGINLREFCLQFNKKCEENKSLEKGTPVPVEINIYHDKTFDFIIKTPPVSYFLKQYAKIEKGSSATKKNAPQGVVTVSQCAEIAKKKMVDLNTEDIEAATSMIKGSALSMGLEVKS